jgi:hypothetical protein
MSSHRLAPRLFVLLSPLCAMAPRCSNYFFPLKMSSVQNTALLLSVLVVKADSQWLPLNTKTSNLDSGSIFHWRFMLVNNFDV